MRLAAVVSILVALTAPIASPQTPALPAELTAEVQQAERDGRRIFEAAESSRQAEAWAIRAIATAEAAPVERCATPYRALAVAAAAGEGGPRVYLLSSLPPDQGLVVGRHFRIDLHPEGDRVAAIARSTNSCFVSPPPETNPGRTPVGMYMTHLLTPTPTEFHVFLSLIVDKPLYVGTQAGSRRIDWVVERGTIHVARSR